MAYIRQEQVEQIKIIEYLKQCTDLPYIHIVNEGKRSVMERQVLSRMGMIAGVCDLFIPRQTVRWAGLWLEIKAGKGRLTSAQILFIERMLKENYFATAVWGADAAIAVIKSHFDLT